MRDDVKSSFAVIIGCLAGIACGDGLSSARDAAADSDDFQDAFEEVEDASAEDAGLSAEDAGPVADGEIRCPYSNSPGLMLSTEGCSARPTPPAPLEDGGLSRTDCDWQLVKVADECGGHRVFKAGAALSKEGCVSAFYPYGSLATLSRDEITCFEQRLSSMRFSCSQPCLKTYP